jgi:hypothetical protein
LGGPKPLVGSNDPRNISLSLKRDYLLGAQQKKIFAQPTYEFADIAGSAVVWVQNFL